tara:strand:- start:89 stop:211 length:123 start_codon:yes stop_codon:yes gene_type:complete
MVTTNLERFENNSIHFIKKIVGALEIVVLGVSLMSKNEKK